MTRILELWWLHGVKHKVAAWATSICIQPIGHIGGAVVLLQAFRGAAGWIPAWCEAARRAPWRIEVALPKWWVMSRMLKKRSMRIVFRFQIRMVPPEKVAHRTCSLKRAFWRLFCVSAFQGDRIDEHPNLDVYCWQSINKPAILWVTLW